MQKRNTGRRVGTGWRAAALLAVGVLLAGCATNIPEPIRRVPASDPGVAQIRERLARDPDCCRDVTVRWGGVILETRNLADSTELIILSQPLGVAGEPILGDRTQGRFIARFARFVEPSLYPREQRITVHGRIRGGERRKIGDYEYLYPVVDVDAQYLWPRVSYADDWDDPWLYPYPWAWPWYVYPWYDPYWGHHH